MLTTAERSWKTISPQIPDVKVTLMCNEALSGHCHWCCTSRPHFNSGFLRKENAYRNGSWQCPSAAVRAPEGSCLSGCSPPVSAVTELVLDSATGSSISQLTNLWLAFLASDAQLEVGAVLVFSSLGISRSSTATMAYLMHSCRFSLQVCHCHSPHRNTLCSPVLFLKPQHCNNNTFSVISCTISTW